MATDNPTMSSHQPFQLLALPREIRDMVYHSTLCDWPEKGPFFHRLSSTPGHGVMLLGVHKVEPNILLANKMVYQEARLVFLKGNKLVHIKMTARNTNLISNTFLRCRVPLVAIGRANVTLFKDLVVMKHSIKFPEETTDSPPVAIDVILQHQHLLDFCGGMAMVDTHSRRFAGQSKHRITIFNPFTTTLSPDLLNPKNQERLLKPYGRRLAGFDHVKVKGNVDPDLAKAVAAKLKQEPPLPSPSTILDKVNFWKLRGDQTPLERELDIQLAIGNWTATFLMIMSFRNHRAWPRLLETAGRGFADRLSDMAFEIHSSLARAYLLIVEKRVLEGDLPGGPTRWMMQITSACTEASEIGRTLGTDWTWSNDQMGTLLYTWAQGHRVMEQDVHFATDLITTADQLRPDDAEISAEMGRISEWRANVGLP